jgi:hypothetical protein
MVPQNGQESCPGGNLQMGHTPVDRQTQFHSSSLAEYGLTWRADRDPEP